MFKKNNTKIQTSLSSNFFLVKQSINIQNQKTTTNTTETTAISNTNNMIPMSVPNIQLTILFRSLSIFCLGKKKKVIVKNFKSVKSMGFSP